jgi:hypothetical protein
LHPRSAQTPSSLTKIETIIYTQVHLLHSQQRMINTNLTKHSLE